METITVVIRLEEPVLVAALEGDPSGSVSFPYIPGSALRGALVGAYLRLQGSQEPLPILDEDVRSLFFGGSHILNAYPLDRRGIRTLPTPRSWFAHKDALVRRDSDEESITLYDLALSGSTAPAEAGQVKAVGKPFCSLESPDAVRLLTPSRHIAVHTERDRWHERAIEGSGALFRYDALAPDQDFGAAILCSSAKDVDTLIELLESRERWTLGGSRSAGYGSVTLSQIRRHRAGWREVGSNRLEMRDGGFTVTLLSDAIVRDGRGQSTSDPAVLSALLAKALGTALDPEEVFLSHRDMGGFNRVWNLPLRQEIALSAGSVLRYHPKHPPDDFIARLQAIEASGIGERREDGFGRIAINWNHERQLQTEGRITPRPRPPRAATLTDAGAQLAGIMVQRLFRQQLDQLVAAWPITHRVVRPRSNSQFTRLRAIIQDALAQGPAAGQPRLQGYLKSIANRQTTRRQFDQTRLTSGAEAGIPLLAWISGLVREPKTVRTELGISDRLPELGGVRAQLTDELAYEYSLRLIDGVLAWAVKSQQEEGATDE